MKKIKVMAIMGMLGLVLTFVPKAGLAADVSVGFFMGLPVPVVTFDPPRVHHAPRVVVAPVPIYPRWHAYPPRLNHAPRVVVAPVPVYPRWHAYGPSYRHRH